MTESLESARRFEPNDSKGGLRFGMTILGAGAMLDALSRVGVGANLLVVSGSLLSCALITRGRSDFRSFEAPYFPIDSGEQARGVLTVSRVAVLFSGVALLAEVVRFVRRGGHDGFPIWLSDLFHEDNSTWIFIGTSSTSADGLVAKAMGYGGSYLLALLNGSTGLYAFVRGVPLESVGIAVSGVGLAYVALLVAVPILCSPVARTIERRTDSRIAALGVLVALSLLLGRFMREARDIGHLSAGVAVLGLTYSAILVTGDRRPLGKTEIWSPGLWAFAFACLLWFPLRPLALLFATWALFEDWNCKGLPLEQTPSPVAARAKAILFFVIVATRAFPDLRSYLMPAEGLGVGKLLAAKGGTYESFDFFLLVTAVFVGSVLLRRGVGSPRERGVLGLLSGYVVIVRFADQMVSNEFQYGSSKLLWIMAPVLILLSAAILVKVDVDGSRIPFSWGGVVLTLCILLANSSSFYGTVRTLGPLVWSDVGNSFVELNNPAREDLVVQWDEPGGLNLQQSAAKLPIACVTVDERRDYPYPLWDFEPYRCTRKVSEMSLEVLRNVNVREQRFDVRWMQYALMEESFISAVMGSVNSTNDLTRNVLVLGRDGSILRTERAIDLLAQMALADPIVIETRPSFSGKFSNATLFNIDSLDQESGEVALWVDNSVSRIIIVSGDDAPVRTVRRDARSDVAETLGRANLLSGLSFSHPSINEDTKCILLADREGEVTLAWSAAKGC